MEPAILAEGLGKTYGATVALDRLDLRVERGEIFGFLGPNGAGKSTTIRLLLDLIRPTAGRALVLGMDCRRQSVAVRASTGYLPGDLRLYPGLRGREMAGLMAGLRKSPVDREFVLGLAERIGLDLEKPAGSLSRGNRQKLGLLLALIGRPPLLLLDEPTSGLDPIVQHTVWNILREEAKRGVTVFFSSHVLSEVDQVCERVGILRAGQLVAVEPVSGLKARQFRHVEVSFAGETPPPAAFMLPGVRELRRERSIAEFEVAGEIDRLLKALAPFHVLDLRTQQPSLDEILLGFYEEAHP
ncbi:MAG: ABC transporter ATP-binding protein [Dehalococcoidia bacterium]|nr:ABC transporter ATP-binding protein [Chloroflexi bacterium CFX7]MCK6563382.1 ABC transporter ATP-binding protein [Dehalococcoidia bacterium]NUQ55836.1 ABC transporter ATP-binding protein [Dehalococcoidia bacterium]RIL03863.1 MAG: ABC transporter [bacterium]